MQKIKCNVYDCSHCDVHECACKLNVIQVASCSLEETKEATMCNSYKKRND